MRVNTRCITPPNVHPRLSFGMRVNTRCATSTKGTTLTLTLHASQYKMYKFYQRYIPLTWHASQYKEHKFHQLYIPNSHLACESIHGARISLNVIPKSHLACKSIHGACIPAKVHRQQELRSYVCEQGGGPGLSFPIPVFPHP